MGIGYFPLKAPPSPPMRHRKQVKSGVSGLSRKAGTRPCPVSPSDLSLPFHGGAVLGSKARAGALLVSEDQACSRLLAPGPPGTHGPLYSPPNKGVKVRMSLLLPLIEEEVRIESPAFGGGKQSGRDSPHFRGS